MDRILIRNDGLHGPARSRGAVVIVSMIALVVMLITVIAVMRSSDGAVGGTGNLSFKSLAVQAAERGVAAAVKQFDPATGALAAAAATEADQPIANYRAALSASDARGIPNVLLDPAAFDTAFPNAANRISLATGETVRWIIDRMCSGPGAADERNCLSESNSEAGGSKPSKKTGGELVPIHRITVRVDGPKNTLHFTQVIFRGA